MGSLRVGLVGAGHIAGSHIRAWRRTPDCAVVGVHDLDRAAAERLTRSHRLATAFDSLDALLASVDVVDVCTPPATHAAVALRAVAAGRHLLLEKPAVVELADWEALSAALAGSPSRVGVVHNLKFARAVERTRRWIDGGHIGTVLRVQREFLTDPAGDRMLGGDRHWSHGLPGGRWIETLPHELYLLHHLVGPMEVREVVVSPTGGAPAGAPADEVLVTLERRGTLATLHYSANCRLNRRRLTVIGSEGWIDVEMLADCARLSRRRDAPWRRALGPQLFDGAAALAGWPADRAAWLARRLRGQTPHAAVIRAFGAYLHGRGEPPTPLAEIDYVVRNTDRIGRLIQERL